MLLSDKDILIYNGQDKEAREFLASLPEQAFGNLIFIDYYENSEHTIRAIEDLRTQGIHFSGSWMFVTLFRNPLRSQEIHIGTMNKPEDWETYEQNKLLKLCEMLVLYTCPESERVKRLQDALAMNADIPLSVMGPILASKTLNQIEGVYAKVIKECILTKECEGAIIKVKELVYAER